VLLVAGASVNAATSRGLTCLLHLLHPLPEGRTLTPKIRKKKANILRTLVAAGIDLEMPFAGHTPLMLASQHGLEECVRVMVAAGVPVNSAKPQDGVTALMVACCTGEVGCVAALHEAKADLAQLTSNGSCALRLACARDQDKSVEALARAGAEVRHFHDSWTPLLEACRNDARRVCLRLVAIGVVPAGSRLCLRKCDERTTVISVPDHPDWTLRAWALALLDELPWAPVNDDLHTAEARTLARRAFWACKLIQREFSFGDGFVDVFYDRVIPMVVRSLPAHERIKITEWVVGPPVD